MRILLAIVAFVIAAAPLGFFAMCVVPAVLDMGLVLTVQEIVADWWNIAILGGCLIVGAAFLCMAVAILAQRPKSNR